MTARIYRPTKTAMQSGRAKTHRWLLEFEPSAPRSADPLMGWTSSSDMTSQVRMFFASKEEALAYAEKHGIDFVLTEPKERRAKAISYAENFRSDRIGLWTH
ncbi:MAG TPA: ETC complex I subunit [Hyphomicrobiales bacterium]|nr:ETC complex I subunit [Hyphomicrobiales bacterium]